MHHYKDSEFGFWKDSAALLCTFNALGLFDMFDMSIVDGFICNNVKHADISLPITQTNNACTANMFENGVFF